MPIGRPARIVVIAAFESAGALAAYNREDGFFVLCLPLLLQEIRRCPDPCSNHKPQPHKTHLKDKP